MSNDIKAAMDTVARQLNHERAELVTKLMDLSKKYDVIAQQEAMHFARNPEVENAKLSATRSLLRCDVQRAAISDAIGLINAYWPDIQKLAPMLTTNTQVPPAGKTS